MSSLGDRAELLDYLTPAERAELARLVEADRAMCPWRPLPGPQTMAYYSEADIIGYGGAAGGGKTDLMLGMGLNLHRNVAIFRREATQLVGIVDRLADLLGNRDGYNGSDKIWRGAGPRGVKIEFGSCPNPGDETKHQGRPKDLLGVDEATNMLEVQARFLMGWVRTTDPDQPCRTLLTFNPPTTVEGRWIIKFFEPWLDKRYPDRAKPGELRYCATLPGPDGKPADVWVPDGRRFVMHLGERVYDFDPDEHDAQDIITPKSRTFIPSRISDNPYLAGTGYMSTLQAMPEPLRSQMLYGDFDAGVTDDPWQVIPTAWVDAAMALWRRPPILPVMDSMGVDVAAGGVDNTVIARRHAHWFDELLAYPGKDTPDGPSTAGLVVSALRDRAPIHLDVIGVGLSAYNFLQMARQQVIGVNVAEGTGAKDISGRMGFANVRSMLWWRMREALDPSNNRGVALPPDKTLAQELCTPKWELRGPTIHVEGRESIIKRIGRSVDRATAVILAQMDTPRMADIERGRLPGTEASHSRKAREYDPMAIFDR